jgi:hypothetical protein
MTNGPESTEARGQAHDNFQGRVTIFAKKCSKQLLQSVRKKSNSPRPFINAVKKLESIAQSAADKRSEIQRKSVSAKTTQFSKNANETKEIAAAGPGYDLTGPLFGPLFFENGISTYGASICCKEMYLFWVRTKTFNDEKTPAPRMRLQRSAPPRQFLQNPITLFAFVLESRGGALSLSDATKLLKLLACSSVHCPRQCPS